MTRAAHTTALAFSGLDEVAALLRRGGGRLSSARRLMLEALWAADGPVSAERLARGLDGLGVPVDVTSVYRNLEHLEELGVVRHVHVGHGPGLYALIRDGEKEFLACERCGRVTSLEPARLDAVRVLIEESFGYRAHFSHFPIMGVCDACTHSDDRHPKPRGTALSAEEHPHEHPHTHEHEHEDDLTHDHPHTEHDHEHTDHEHQHTHGDVIHSHPHVHEEGLEADHAHPH